ncbi:hypothetical protein MUY27_15095 [Mucilaginibacter sp. RS28]|uniref:Uncharacterized protein n=1 Tax=Mucilaginibacter straminoryzae TaxID=2932774 RepID=A0A9X1X4Z7_9SPHI|nr:hypothetical protein [Mucilaginibacter straminoryzae]MCJ8211043.1 hypothetical protein [Mucilaginibacter straminoryzae]
MKTQAEKQKLTHNSSAGNTTQRSAGRTGAHLPAAGLRTATPYQAMADASPRIKQLKDYQNMADGNTKQLKTISPVNNLVVQRLPSWVPFFGKKKEEDRYAHLTDNGRRAAYFGDAIHRDEHAGRRLERRGQRSDQPYRGNESLLAEHENAVYDARSTPRHETAVEKTGQIGSAGSFIGSQTTNLSHLINNDTLGATGEWTKVAGQGLGVVGSLANAGVGIHDIITSQNQKKDKAIKAVDVISSLSSAAQTGANGLGTLSGVVPTSGALSAASSIASKVIAPAAIVKSSADVVTGLATGGLAHYRSNKLEQLGKETMDENGGIIKFAQDNQWTKAKANYAKAVGGALGVAGGALLAASLTNPVGWGLLAAAGGVALGVSLYKMYKKHQSGKEILKDPHALRYGKIEVQKNVPRKGFGDYFKTEEMRRHEDVRGQIATKLSKDEGRSYYNDEPNTASKIVRNLGVREKPKPDDKTELLSYMWSDDAEKARQDRAKAIAKGLDF